MEYLTCHFLFDIEPMTFLCLRFKVLNLCVVILLELISFWHLFVSIWLPVVILCKSKVSYFTKIVFVYNKRSHKSFGFSESKKYDYEHMPQNRSRNIALVSLFCDSFSPMKFIFFNAMWKLNHFDLNESSRAFDYCYRMIQRPSHQCSIN